MKNIIILITTLFLYNISFAQTEDKSKEDNEYHTLFSNESGKTKVSGFGTLALDFGGINNDFGLMIGGEGAVLINRSFFIGLYGRGSVTMPSYTYTYYSERYANEVSVNKKVSFGHGGLMFGAIFNAEKPIHFGFTIRIGGGGMSLVDYYMKDMHSSSRYYYDYPHVAPLFVMSPQLDFEMNMTNWMKFRVSAGYQYVSSASLMYNSLDNGSIVKKELFNTNIYNTPTLSLGFIFGCFK